MQAIHTVSQQETIPKDILTAVALTETGTMQKGRLAPYPWAINVEGKGFLFSTKQKAIDAVTNYLKQGKKSIDIGCMQLNWYWHGDKFGHSLEKAFNPHTNITVGAKYIKEHYRTYKNWNKAVGRYHSGTAKFAQQYYQKYASNLRIAQSNLGISSTTAPVAIASIGDFPAYDDTHYNKRLTQKSAYKLSMLNQSSGSLINFQTTGDKPKALVNLENRGTALIKLPNAPVPILDTALKRSLFQ
jgi:hypothetical protein